jgi:hypothetical protein
MGKRRRETYGGDHLAYAVCVDQADVESEGDQVVVEDAGLEREVGCDEGPGGEEWDEAEEGGVGVFAAFATRGHDVRRTVFARERTKVSIR